jgi:hypothetical protein
MLACSGAHDSTPLGTQDSVTALKTAHSVLRGINLPQHHLQKNHLPQHYLPRTSLPQSISTHKVFVRKTLESAICRSELCGEDSRSPRYKIQHPRERRPAISASVGQIRALQGFAKCGRTSAKSVAHPQIHLSSANSFVLRKFGCPDKMIGQCSVGEYILFY